MSSRKKTANDIRRAGIAALTRALGPVEAIRFLQQFDLGSGDYTAERARLIGNPIVDDLLHELKARRGRPKTAS